MNKSIKKKNKKNKRKSIRNKKYQKHKRNGGGKYIYYPKDNIIQFMPYSYPTSTTRQQPYLGSQMGGNSLIPMECGDFNPNMLERKFDCNQPFWSASCI